MNKVYSWNLHGKVFLWEFVDGPKSYKDLYQLGFDAIGRDSFKNLIKLMLSCEEEISRTMPLALPTNADRLPIDVERWKIKSWKKLIVSIKKADGLCLEQKEDIIVLSMGNEGVEELYSTLINVTPQNELVIQNICGNKNKRMLVWW